MRKGGTTPPGADFVPGLHSERLRTIWRKGFQRDFEAYAVTAQHPGLFDLYRAEKITAVVICGLATNILLFSSPPAISSNAGFRVMIVEDASAGIDVPAAGLFQAKAKAEAIAAGIEYVHISLISWFRQLLALCSA